jgi:hypothetical protein
MSTRAALHRAVQHITHGMIHRAICGMIHRAICSASHWATYRRDSRSTLAHCECGAAIKSAGTAPVPLGAPAFGSASSRARPAPRLRHPAYESTFELPP